MRTKKIVTRKIVIASFAAFGLAIASATAGVAASLPNIAALKTLGKGEGALNSASGRHVLDSV